MKEAEDYAAELSEKLTDDVVITSSVIIKEVAALKAAVAGLKYIVNATLTDEDLENLAEVKIDEAGLKADLKNLHS